MLNVLKKILPTLLTIAGVAATVLSGNVQGLLAAHPTAAAIVAAVWSILLHLMPSPMAPVASK